MKKIFITFFWVFVLTLQILADTFNKPIGFKLGQRMTVKPHVGFSYTYDSNVDSSKNAKGGSSWIIAPGVNFDYLAEKWKLDGSGYYQYHSYAQYSRHLNEGSFGEKLNFSWANGEKYGPGQTFILSEDYRKISQDDDMSNDGGRGIGRDRDQFQFNGILEHRFMENWHININANYYYLDYENDKSKYAPLYGWTRWVGGLAAGYTATKWTDFIIAGNYQSYTQENDTYMGGEVGPKQYKNIDDKSEGWTVQGGITTYATERISYRALIGWSAFKYSGGTYDDNAFTYGLTANWKMQDYWNLMLMATRYYQPAEREYSAALLADALSFGIAHSMIRGKLNATLDFAYRHEQHVCSGYQSSDYDEDILTGRFGLNYAINRYISIYCRIEYQMMFVDHDGTNSSLKEYDYDRWRGTIGFKLTY